MILEFYGNGHCDKGGCKVIVDLDGNYGENKKWSKANKPFDIIELQFKKLNSVDYIHYDVIPPKFINCQNNDYTNCQ